MREYYVIKPLNAKMQAVVIALALLILFFTGFFWGEYFFEKAKAVAEGVSVGVTIRKKTPPPLPPAPSPLPLPSVGGEGGGKGRPVPIFSNIIKIIKSEPPYGIADLNYSGKVDLTDLSILLYWWGRKDFYNVNSRVDLNRDGKVNLIDFSIMLHYWKK